MDVSYSVWREVAAEKLELAGDSFSFLFDRRYSNRLNRMSRVFFEAYAKATFEVSAEEDRFPSLSEIESRMESGAIYAYKDRLMRSTGFFEEVKISGISYLIPRARRFVDESGTYTDLILNLEDGEVALPRREKPSAVAKGEGAGSGAEDESTFEPEPEDESDELSDAEPEIVEASGIAEVPIEEAEKVEAADAAGGTPAEEAAMEAEGEVPPPEEEAAQASSETAETPAAEMAIEVETESARIEKPAEIDRGAKERAVGGEEGSKDGPIEPQEGEEAAALAEAQEPEPAAVEAAVETVSTVPEMGSLETGSKAGESERKPGAAKDAALPSKHHHHHPPEPKAGKGLSHWGGAYKGPILALAGVALILLAAFLFWSPQGPETPATPSDFVSYSAYLSNATGITYLNLDVENPKGLDSEVELVLPPDVDRSISATGGIVTISYTTNTVIKLNSSSNASVSVALADEYILVPVTFNLAIPTEYESSVLVYDKDYRVSRTNSTISLWCNVTDDHLDFDQIYNAKKVSGGPGPEEGGPGNATDGPPPGTSGPEPENDL